MHPIPVEIFGGTGLVPGDAFHFDVGINDADNPARNTQLMWSGGRDNWTNPAVFGRLHALP